MSQERWDVLLRFVDGPLSFQGIVTARGPVGSDAGGDVSGLVPADAAPQSYGPFWCSRLFTALEENHGHVSSRLFVSMSTATK